MAWFWRGAQSAFFYYVSCAPCATARFNHRRAKEKSRVDKATKAALQRSASRHGNGDVAMGERIHGDDHELLTGVGAFTTNIYWQEEIDIGPNFKKGTKPVKDSAGDRRYNKKGKGRIRATSGKKSMQGDVRSHRFEGEPSLDSLRTEDAENDNANRPLSAVSGNQKRRYQRPDEALWGNAFPEKDWTFYARGRNPSINSLTPPVVSTLPATAEEASWMLQPPPPAKVMEGKQMPARRSHSFGAASKVSAVSKVSKRTGGTRFSELKRPENVVLADLGENMCSMTLAPQPERKVLRRLDADGALDSSRPTTPEWGHERADSAFSAFSTPSGHVNRPKRTAPATTLENDGENSRDAYGFEAGWTFPRQPLAQTSPNIPRSFSPEYYHSEPEPDMTSKYGIDYRDFARRQTQTPYPRSGTAGSDAAFQTPKSKASKATTRAASDRSSSRSSVSPESSSSSLHVLQDVLAPAMVVDPKAGVDGAALGTMDGIAEDDAELLKNVNPQGRYAGGPREVRLNSGTQ